MGLLDNTTNQAYYEGNNYGNYQFVSLDDIINQFQVSYVGQDKIIPRIRRADIAFHAMRALQELSFDTFKSVKSQEITLPPSLKMILPQDYVNYTGVYFTDESGIKHPLYETKHTSNPFTILQEEDGKYSFADDAELIADPSFEDPSGALHPNWSRTPISVALGADPTDTATGANGFSSLARMFGGGFKINQDSAQNPSGTATNSNSLQFRHAANPVNGGGGTTIIDGRVLACWQEIDVRGINFLDLGANVSVFLNDGTGATYSTNVPNGKIIIGLQTVDRSTPQAYADQLTGMANSRTVGPSFVSQPQHPLYNPNFFSRNINNPDVGFIEFDGTAASTEKEATIDVSAYEYLYFMIISKVPVTTVERDATSQVLGVQPPSTGTTPVFPIQFTFQNQVNSVTLKNIVPPSTLSHANPLTNDSNTWSNYKSHTPNENVVIDYDYDDPRFHNLNKGQRYGLEPSHAQVNGSFYIDNLQGYINFSSNISGKNIILDYVSDGLGTDEEMQVHKFAEEAMYKHMLCDIMSGRTGVPEYAIRRYKQEKRATRRNAKLRLSNIKLEQIIQTFRNKSKIIK
tara:strand:+ start:762 stop:2480 length:1719 start_codon:yes stop_codon:yes gene_type:complete